MDAGRTAEWLSVHIRDGAYVQYSGVMLSDICREVGIKPEAKWVLAEGGILRV